MNSPVPVFTHTLRSLSARGRAEAHCGSREIEPDRLLVARIAPDTPTLTRDVQSARDTAKGRAARRSRTPVPHHEDSEATLAQLRERIAKTVAFVEMIPDAAIKGAERRDVTMAFGSEARMFNGVDIPAASPSPASIST